MTREEAVARIKDHIEIHRYHERNAVKIFEALDMAIKALEQPEPCMDVVSREAAIDAIISFFKLTDYNESAYAVKTVLNDLPSAQPKWIPVEEKLPDEHDSIFKRFYGTNKWTDLMFLKRSDDVFVIEICDGEKQVGVAHTCDG